MREPQLPHTAVDIDLKAFFKVRKEVPFRLLGQRVDPQHIRPDDTTIVVRKLQADRFFLYEPPGKAREALLLELFMDPPRRRQLLDCLIKPLQMMRDLEIQVVLVLLYLRKGAYATFPDGLSVESFDGLTNQYRVEARNLWDYEDQIRHGDLQALAPLLLLWEDKPEDTGWELLREEIRIIEGAGFTDQERRELLALTYILGLRTFPASALRTLFGEAKMNDVKQSEIIREWLARSGVGRP